MAKKLKVNVKVSKEKFDDFQNLVEGLIASGQDMYLTEGQSEVWVYLPEPHGFNLALSVNGTWKLT